MKKFAKRHAVGILICAFAFACITAALSVFLYFDFTAQREGEEYAEYLSRTELESSARGLISAIEAGDGVEAYHRAEMSAFYASRAGDSAAAVYFRGTAEALKAGNVSTDAVKAEVAEYIEKGVLPLSVSLADGGALTEKSEQTDSSDGFLYDYKLTEAQKKANAIFGLDGVLSTASKSGNGRLIFTCENAYAVIDGSSGLPTELGISLPCGEEILTLDECDSLAREFMRKFFSKKIAESAELSDAEPDGEGKYDFKYICRDVEMCISVKRDTGKIVGFVMK